MKNNLHHSLILQNGHPNSKIIRFWLYSLCNKKLHFKQTIYDVIIFLILICLSNWTVFAQNGEAVNEGVFKIEPTTIVSSESDFTNEQTGELTNDGEFILKADFSNYGNLGFTSQEQGYTRFEGTGEQLIYGSSPFNLKNVLFESRETGIRFLLDNDVNIYGIADFTSGIIDNTEYIGRLTFYDDANALNASNASYVNGPVKKYSNNDFTFPVGKEGFYRWAKLSEISSISALYEVTYFLKNSGEIHSHENKEEGILEIDDREYWSLVEEIPNDEELLLTLSWNEETTSPSIYETAAEDGIVIVRWDEQNQIWVNEGGIVDIQNQSVTTSIQNKSIYTLGRIDSDDTSPCDLAIYNAVTPNGDGINDYFRIDIGNAECAKKLMVKIFNRWGVKVFETNNYGIDGDVFDGFSSGRLTLANNKQLPSGTYYYIIDYQYGEDSNFNQHRKAGYLHLSGN